MDKLQEWEKDLSTLQELNKPFRLAIWMRAPWQPFKSEWVAVEKLDEHVKAGWIIASRELVPMIQPDTRLRVQVARELVNQYQKLDYTLAE
jgi:hypothetical protein